jgi:hypothetical protein
MNAKFSFYEVALIESSRPALQEVAHHHGAVLGMARNDDGVWVYAVHVLDQGEVWDVRESELRPTGRHMKREDFYSGDTVKVEVDADTREGRIVDES